MTKPIKCIVVAFFHQLLQSSIITSNNLSNENINTGVSVVSKTKHESKCQNELFLSIVSLKTPASMFFDKLLT